MYVFFAPFFIFFNKNDAMNKKKCNFAMFNTIMYKHQNQFNMKKLFLIALMLVAAVGMKADDKVTARVSGTSLNIALENATTYCAFQMDIQLPEGITATEVAAAANRLSQEGSDAEIGGTKFIVAHNTIDGNVLRVIAYNLANAEIANATGDILNITLSEAVADPTTITVSNILFVSASDLAEVALGDATGENGVMLGDVTGDGNVNVFDISAIATIILGGDTTGLNLSAADVTGDGVTNVFDISAIASLILE